MRKNITIQSHGANPDRCYVVTGFGPASVWRAYKRGSYARVGPGMTVADAGSGLQVRLGAYGDPAMIPFPIVAALVSRSAGWTGYTHRADADPRFATLLMRSIDPHSPDGAAEDAQSAGWRTFRAYHDGGPGPGEIECPAYSRGVQCADCGLCDGMGTAPRERGPVVKPSTEPGVVIWEGPSPIDGAPLVAILTGRDGSSGNGKTGPMAQLWILHADEHPSAAQKSGADASACGDCPLRPLLEKTRR